MIIGAPKENRDEPRVALTPQNAKKLASMGAEVLIEKGLGESCNFNDADYTLSGARIESRSNILSKSDIIIRLRKPENEEVEHIKRGSIHISYLDPFNNRPLLDSLAKQGVTAICIEMIPRISRAQKMDALSSQASLAGYVAVLLAAERSSKVFPMMMTPAGTITPSKIFVIGAGVAGLQAIATAKRLGARVEAFDTRPVVEEQVKSLGAHFVKIELGETGQTAQGYAKELTKEQIEKQRELMAGHCASADVVITTAQLFGKKAPIIVTKEMVQGMKPGSIIVDLAIETGGNVEGAVLGEEITPNGVRIIGLPNLPGHAAVHASQMYSNNVVAIIEEFWDREAKLFRLNLDDEILKSSVITHDGKIVHSQFSGAP
ncbi:MAG TPA: Re/Si-specific NAD(P)(+) transhydrogenase subunit alpha [Candidatus Nanoarchaeia archaeon]|nr:Re/Si-specific NAD(P)(+) transhydrogenase subunit alpha [Candidatus Nanoarchaeia archaeon]